MKPLLSVLLLCVLVSLAGCQQKMADQPSYRPLQPSAFFSNGKSAQPLPNGAVAREWVLTDSPLLSGLKAEFRKQPPAPADAKAAKAAPPPDSPSSPDRFVAAFPFQPTRDDLNRGQERFTIYCAVCHDPVGTGRGKIVERGYIKPPNYHSDNSRGFGRYGIQIPLRDVPVGYLFEVITRGYGAMPRYGPQIEPRDRWRIVAYVRALQLSQHADLGKLPDAMRKQAERALGGKP